MRADLHIHTTASDGRWGPERVVVEVQARSIGLFAVTDHDTIANVAPVEALAREAGLSFLRGVEIGTQLDNHQFHILGYGFELDSPTLNKMIQKHRAELDQAGEEVIRHLAAVGYPVDVDDYLAYEYERTRGAWKAFNYLVDREICKDIKEYFGNPDIKLPSELCRFSHPAQAIAAIREANGVPILAHAGITLRNTGLTDEALQPLLDAGIAGLECYYINHDEAMTRFCLDWCARHDLITTVGSDCHGGLVGRELGFPPTDTADLRLGELEQRIIR
jgi:predicted metal-dependent phosphoesterase TrpH